MVKKSLLLLVCILCAEVSFAKPDEDNIILQCMQAVMDNKIPEGFQRSSRTIYLKETKLGTAALYIENGVISLASIGNAFETTHEAVAYLTPFFDLFEEIGTYYDTYYGDDVYRIGQIFVIIRTKKRDDGLIAAGINFVKDLQSFFN